MTPTTPPQRPSTVSTAAVLLAAAGSLLSQTPAMAQVYNESSAPGGDFGNTFALRTPLTLSTTQVNGGIPAGGGSDPDFFSFSGLPGGATYSLGITAGNPANFYFATFQGYDDSGATIGTSMTYNGSEPINTQKTITGTVPASGILTIGVSPQSTEGGGSSNYSTTLSVVPEPATTALVALGAAAAALAARRGRKQSE